MGQAKQRGTKEERTKKAMEGYYLVLDELSKYGLTVEELHRYFGGKKKDADHCLSQVEDIVKNNGIQLKLLIKDNRLAFDINAKMDDEYVSDDERDMIALLTAIDDEKKPENMNHSLFISNLTKKERAEQFGQDGLVSFDLKIGENKEYFYNLISKSLIDAHADDLDYYTDILETHSNHRAMANKHPSFHFERNTKK